MKKISFPYLQILHYPAIHRMHPQPFHILRHFRCYPVSDFRLLPGNGTDYTITFFGSIALSFQRKQCNVFFFICFKDRQDRTLHHGTIVQCQSNGCFFTVTFWNRMHRRNQHIRFQNRSFVFTSFLYSYATVRCSKNA